jgi:hypothetical protein
LVLAAAAIIVLFKLPTAAVSLERGPGVTERDLMFVLESEGFASRAIQAERAKSGEEI